MKEILDIVPICKGRNWKKIHDSNEFEIVIESRNFDFCQMITFIKLFIDFNMVVSLKNFLTFLL